MAYAASHMAYAGERTTYGDERAMYGIAFPSNPCAGTLASSLLWDGRYPHAR